MVHYRVYRDEADLPISARIKQLETERVIEEKNATPPWPGSRRSR